MPGLVHSAQAALAKPIEHAIVADGQVLAMAGEELVDLIDRQPAALHELLGERPCIAPLALHAVSSR